MEKELILSASPHIRDKESVTKIMWMVNLSLVPAGLGAVYFFGFQALWVILISVVTAIVTEAGMQKLLKKPVTITDGSAIVTGILLAFNVSADVPWWMPVVGTAFAIIFGKHVFGGLGFNPMNPALLGRAFLMASWPARMTIFTGAPPRDGTISGIAGAVDGITNATPLNVMKTANEILAKQAQYSPEQLNQAKEAISQLQDAYGNLFWGRIGGCLGETSVFLLLIGAAFLMYRRYIGWKIPFSYIGTVALLSWIFGDSKALFNGNPLFHILSGGLILGAFFMATDMVTSPITYRGRIIFGIGCGVITMLIRLVGGYPEGVSYSILLMNLTVPLLDRYTKPGVFGGKKKK